MSRNPALAHLQTASLYTLVRGKHAYPYATASQLARLLERDWLAAGGVLSADERREIQRIVKGAQIVKVAIVGSREYPRLSDVYEYVKSLPLDTVIVSGGATGVDQMAEITAKERGMATEIYLPDWKNHGKSAGFIRNEEIIKAADKIVAFHANSSKGTAHSIRLAEKYGKPLEVHSP